MTDETRTIEAEAAETRDRIADTIDELQARLSPKALVDNAVASLSSAGTNAVSSLRGAASAHPLVLGIAGLAVGIGLLAGSRVRRAKIEYGDSYAAYADFDDGYAANLAETEPASATRAHLDRFQHQASATVDDNPLVVLAIGAATGALLGAVIPVSEVENDLFGEVRGRIEAAADFGDRRCAGGVRPLAPVAQGRRRRADGTVDGLADQRPRRRIRRPRSPGQDGFRRLTPLRDGGGGFRNKEQVMRRTVLGLTVAALALAPMMAVPAAAQVAATPAEAASAGEFISQLADRVFAVLKENQSKAAIKTKFRAMLKDNFAVDDAGLHLIRRYRNQITPAQLAAYQAVLPDYIVNVYADRLINYADASVKIVRTQAHGSNGSVDVFSRVQAPGKDAFDIIWQVQKAPSGKWLIANVTVSGINMSLTQEADFSAFIQKNGFDALVAMMKSANTRSA